MIIESEVKEIIESKEINVTRIDEVERLDSSEGIDTPQFTPNPLDARLIKNEIARGTITEPARDEKGYWLKGYSGNPSGYPKTIQDRQEKIAKSYLDEFIELGGQEGLHAWIMESKRNRNKFYDTVLLRLLPKEIQVDSSTMGNEIIINWNKSAPIKEEGRGDKEKEVGGV